MNVKIYIGNDKLDLFKDENISITSSVTDIEDITKNTTDYSKSFTVPASETNNKIFKHYYNANVDNTFDARTKVDGRIELDGLVFRIGKFLLQKVKVTKGVPSSYTINFWGNLVSIKDLLGKDKLSELDFDAFNHSYTSDNVKLGLTSSLFDGDMIYNLLVKKQYYYNLDSGDTTQTDTFSNIAYNTTSGDNGVAWNDLRPSIRLIKIIEAIESKYELTFSRHYFGRTEFTDLFMWLNSDAKEKIVGGELRVDWDSGSSDYMNFFTDVGTYDIKNHRRKWWQLYITITPSVGYEDVEYTVRAYRDDDELVWQRSETGTEENKVQMYVDSYSDGDHDMYFTIDASQEFKFTSKLKQQRKDYWGNDGSWTTYGSEQTISSDFIVKNNLPKLEVIKFLKGIFQTSKLVVIPQQDGTIYVNTLIDYQREGELLDITEYTDTSKNDVERGKILNEISYKFSEPKTILNRKFEETNGKAYGDEEITLKDDEGEVLDGESLEIELPFEQFIYDRLIDVNDSVQTNIMYGAIIDDKLAPVSPKPHIFYNVPVEINGKVIGFIDDNKNKIALNGLINTPSHINSFDNVQYSFLFSQEFNPWDGQLITKTLYSNYHGTFINAIFNIKRRSFKYKANLPIRILDKLGLNDTILIGYDYYKIDKFTVDLQTGETEFNLVNSFTFEIGGMSTQNTNIDLTFESQSYNSYVTNLKNYTVTKIDEGDGIGWVTVTDDGNGNLIFTVTQNDNLTRVVSVQIKDDDTLQILEYLVVQSFGGITADTTLITADNNSYTL